MSPVSLATTYHQHLVNDVDQNIGGLKKNPSYQSSLACRVFSGTIISLAPVGAAAVVSTYTQVPGSRTPAQSSSDQS